MQEEDREGSKGVAVAVCLNGFLLLLGCDVANNQGDEIRHGRKISSEDTSMLHVKERSKRSYAYHISSIVIPPPHHWRDVDTIPIGSHDGARSLFGNAVALAS